MIAGVRLTNKKVNPVWKLCTYLEEVTRIGINQISVMHIVVPRLEESNVC